MEFFTDLLVFLSFAGPFFYIVYKLTRAAYSLLKGVPREIVWNDVGLKISATIATIAISLTVIGIIYSHNASSPSTQRQSVSHANMAFIQCKEMVRNRLKAPSTAEFPFLDFQAKAVTDKRYIINSYVDAQNSFGAKIRNRFVCDIEWNGNSDSDSRNWTLLNLELSE